MHWWAWLLLGWALLAPVTAVIVGKAIRVAESLECDDDQAEQVADVDARHAA